MLATVPPASGGMAVLGPSGLEYCSLPHTLWGEQRMLTPPPQGGAGEHAVAMRHAEAGPWRGPHIDQGRDDRQGRLPPLREGRGGVSLHRMSAAALHVDTIVFTVERGLMDKGS